MKIFINLNSVRCTHSLFVNNEFFFLFFFFPTITSVCIREFFVAVKEADNTFRAMKPFRSPESVVQRKREVHH